MKIPLFMKLKECLYYLLLISFLSACSSDNEDIPGPDPTPGPGITGEYTPKKLGNAAFGFDPLTLFTDASCSALKAGITDEDIKACKSDFHKNIAQYMKAGKYPAEFRIQEYKAYPHPDMQAKTNKTSPYSLLDNPTGMAIGEGEELVIFVGNTHGQKIQIRIQDLNVPEDDGFGGLTYSLSEGVNQINAPKKGLIYLLYHTENFENAQPVKVHIASGHVNGYFDVTKHAGSDWKRLRDAAKEPYFDVVGKYAHITFPTRDFILYTPDGKALIEAYDKIVASEMMLMGLFKYDKVFKNRMYFNVTYRGYMYATSYHTAYHESTMPEMCDVNKLTDSSIWGPCHEVGHCNQTRPGLKWHGTTEVTNNIMSMYLQTSIFNRNSNLQTTKLGDGSPNRYAKAWTEIIAAQASHADFESNDVFCKLVPFWQLELYFGNVLGRTPLQQDDMGGFYPDVYEYVRTHPDLATAGEQQTEFAYICSQIAQMDLTDFFTKWGFLTPVENVLDDYGSGLVKVTQERVDEIKQRIASLNYPKPDVALEYITDNNWKFYQDIQPVVKGQSSRSGRTLKMTDWKNVVAYEVVNKDGQKIFISEGVLQPDTTATFTIKTDWEDGFKVYAVSASGERTEVTF